MPKAKPRRATNPEIRSALQKPQSTRRVKCPRRRGCSVYDDVAHHTLNEVTHPFRKGFDEELGFCRERGLPLSPALIVRLGFLPRNAQRFQCRSHRRVKRRFSLIGGRLRDVERQLQNAGGGRRFGVVGLLGRRLPEQLAEPEAFAGEQRRQGEQGLGSDVCQVDGVRARDNAGLLERRRQREPHE